MKSINNQTLIALYTISICQFILFSCQSNSTKSADKNTLTTESQLFKRKSITDTIAINDIWLVKDSDIEKGNVIRAYKISSISTDSIKYIKSKISIDTTRKNWQMELDKQLNFDVNIQFRVHKSVKDKWQGSNKIIHIYYN